MVYLLIIVISVPPVTEPLSRNIELVELSPTITHRLHSVFILGSEYNYKLYNCNNSVI